MHASPSAERAPSLLAGSPHGAAAQAPRMLAGLGGSGPVAAPVRQRWPWLAAVAGVSALLIGYAVWRPTAEPAPGLAAVTPASVRAQPAPPPAEVQPVQAAVAAEPAASVATARLETVAVAPTAGASAVMAGASTAPAVTGGDAVRGPGAAQIAAMPDTADRPAEAAPSARPAAPRRAAAPVARKSAPAAPAAAAVPESPPALAARPASPSDPDVDLLAAIIAHPMLGTGGAAAQPPGAGIAPVASARKRSEPSIASLVKDCQRRGSKAEVLACKRRICQGSWGKAQACPKSLASRKTAAGAR